jgi:diguanylate cyclase (GGDEF)-like protein
MLTVFVVSRQWAALRETARLSEKLRQQSIRDPLTGLFNRRYMEESLERELKRMERLDCPLGVIMLDIDYFKRFNDTFGHDAGDLVLRQASAFLHGHIRGADIACRYGGEEFILVLPEASLAAAQSRAEQLRLAIKAMAFEHEGRPLGAISICCGVAVYPDHGRTPAAMLRAADGALYRAKHAGRDQVVVAE